MSKISNKQVQLFCDYLNKEYINKLSGESEEDEYIIGERPSERITIGLLDSGNNFDIQSSNNATNKFEVMKLLKVSFYLKDNAKGHLHINVKGNLFYNIIPDYADQRLEELKKEKPSNSCEIVNKFKRIKIDEALRNIVVDVEELIKNTRIDLSEAINSQIENIAIEDSIYYKDNTYIPTEKLVDKQTFYDFIEKEKIVKQRPVWKLKVTLDCKKSNSSEGQYIVTLVIINKTPKSQQYNPSREEKIFYPTAIYNVGVEIIGENVEFQSNRLPYFSNSYKVDSNSKVKGEWIAAEFDEHRNMIYTTNVPEYIEYRRKTVEIYNKNTLFEELIKEPVKNLNTIYDGMREYIQKMEQEKIKLPSSSREEFEKDISDFKAEMKRFKIGINVLEDYPEVKKAFECMNKTFMCNKKYSSWRLFQLVYIVSMIPDIIYNEHIDELKQLYDYNYEEETEILYFPTGGGKTEAFLGCSTFAMFYERLMGKEYGVSSIIKYPLRLLSIQQLERTLKVIMNANKVMENTEELRNKEFFTLGYFVGESNTPNKIKETEKNKIVENDKYLLVHNCPNCNEKIKLRYDDESKTLQHYCNKCKKQLPLYIVDDDIYRFLPTIIISIVDKLTQISFSNSFKNLLGAPGYRCKKHGFSCNKKCICDVNCDVQNVVKKSKISFAPSLFIQDELHLLKESLGAFTAHYESFCKYYIKELLENPHKKRIKYIGATATVSGADKLVKNLYGESSRVFPCRLTDKQNANFYSYIDKEDISRRIIGFAPHGRSINAGMEYSVTVLRKILYDMYNNPQKHMNRIDGFKLSDEDFKEIIFYYWTSIVYFNSKNDNNKLRNTFDQQANIERLGDIPKAKFDIIKMTGDEDFNEIKNSLNEIESERDKMKTHNLILATSTISHGVDEDEFNNIFFYGIPSNTAEYIQAYSRVGRKYEGLVIDIIRLARQRDISYLNFFNLFHKYKDYLIYDVPINSTAINAMRHTFPGIFIGLLKQYYSNRDNKDYSSMGEFQDAINNQKIEIKELYERLIAIYNVDILTSDVLSKEYMDAIKRELISVIRGISDKINSIKKSAEIKKHIEEFTTTRTKVMSSLRDVDDTVNITIRFNGGYYEKK